MRRSYSLGVAALVLVPGISYANFIWPPFIFVTGYEAWWAICAGLVVEWFAYLKAFDLSKKQALVATITMNIASAMFGIFYSFFGLLLLGVESLTIVFVYSFIPLIYLFTVAIEYHMGVKEEDLPKGRRTLFVIALANFVSIGLVVWQGIAGVYEP